jgi:hypothetical protein
VLAAAIFAALMLVVTLAHYDRFNHGDAPLLAAVAFYGWIGVYMASPPVVGWLWRRDQRLGSPRRAPGDVTVPPSARRLARLLGAGALIGAGVFLISPSRRSTSGRGR